MAGLSRILLFCTLACLLAGQAAQASVDDPTRAGGDNRVRALRADQARRDALLTACRDDPGHRRGEPDCVNAERAQALQQWQAAAMTSVDAAFSHLAGALRNAAPRRMEAAIVRLTRQLQPLVYSMMTLLVLLTGYELLARRDRPFEWYVRHSLLVAVVTSLALSPDRYLSTVAANVQALAGWLGQPWISPDGGTVRDGFAQLDQFASQAQAWVAQLAGQAADDANPGSAINWLLCTAIVAASAGGWLCLAASLLVMPSLMVTLLLAMGPVFLVLLLFPALQRWTSAWLGALAGALVFMALGTPAVGLLSDVVAGALPADLSRRFATNPLRSTMLAATLCATGALMLLALVPLASSVNAGLRRRLWPDAAHPGPARIHRQAAARHRAPSPAAGPYPAGTHASVITSTPARPASSSSAPSSPAHAYRQYALGGARRPPPRARRDDSAPPVPDRRVLPRKPKLP
ncbi:type IV secretion system protein [Bordetella bronchiseptica]|uniref:type IV secretion system protein n=1 Tax=Bordetella bronchiseptica TaxID=518 RepID=UPI0004A15D30|nr:type IV secretion system protein [Bordetella bronchiseptica]KDD97280.1 TrbL/VirB6 plasmid conjugal transfer protein [Bordetella bronchiseptica MO275]